MVVVKFLLNLGFEINYRDNARKTALFFAIEKGHLEVADYLIERAASIWVRSSNKVTPHSLLKKVGHKPPERKRKLASPTPSCICPGAATRSRFAEWEWAYDEDEPQVDRTSVYLRLILVHSLVVIKHCTASAPARAASLLR